MRQSKPQRAKLRSSIRTISLKSDLIRLIIPQMRINHFLRPQKST
nr:MAG TPA: hypothetical protein [Caudoviricetes sp.]